MTKATPLISDIELTKYEFSAGDRLLVRVAYDLEPEQQHKLYKAISKFTKEDTRILIANCRTTRMLKIAPNGFAEALLDERIGDNYRMPQLLSGQMEVNCSVVDLREKDMLSVQLKNFPQGKLQTQRVLDWLRQWTGKDVEIRLMRWV